MKKILLIIFIVLLMPCMGHGAATIYHVAASAAGTQDGSTCVNAKAISWDWTSPNVVAGDSIHICGETITGTANQTLLQTRANGTSGSPITILFEDNAVLQATYFGTNGAIYVPNNYITVDGGTNGIIRNTMNGTSGGACSGGACNQQQDSMGVLSTGSNVTITKLTVSKIYVKTEGTNDSAGDSNQAIQTQGSNTVVSYCTIDNAYTGIGNGGTDISTIEYHHNTVTFCNHSIKSGINNGTVTDLSIHDNDISSMYNWDQPDNHYHHNGIFVFADPAGSHVNAKYYNNYIHGMNSRDSVYGASHVTGWIFIEFSNPGALIYNNVLQADAGAYNYPANGYITIGGGVGTQYVYNNTIIGGNNGGNCIRGGSTGLVAKNNILVYCGNQMSFPSANTSQDIDYNLYYNFPDDAWDNGTGPIYTFADWKTACACDGNSICTGSSCSTSDPGLDGAYKPDAANDLVVGIGVQLNTSFTADKAGTTRGTVWDIGAYEYEAGGEPDYTMTLTKAGTGSGSVSSSPAGISCGATCTYDFDASTEVTLTATADYGNAFTGWSGTGGCTGTSTCVLTMSEAKAATATFQPRKITFGGSGTITTGGSGTITLQ